MGDRTTATLHLAGTITTADGLEGLWASLRSRWALERAQMAKAPKPGPLWRTYSFNEVNYGRLYQELESQILALGLSYVWEHGRGHDYPACMQVWHAGTLHHEQLSHAQEPYLEYSQRDDAERRAAIAAFLAARDAVFAQPFLYAPSAHSLLAIHAQKDQP